MSERPTRRFAQSLDIVLGERCIFVQEPLLRPSITTEMLRSEAPRRDGALAQLRVESAARDPRCTMLGGGTR